MKKVLKVGLATTMALMTVAHPAFAASTPGASATAAEGAAAVDPARLALGREIVDIVLPPAQREQIMAAILRSMMQNMIAGIEKGAGITEDLDRKPALKAAFSRFVDRQQQLAEADINGALPGLIDAYAHAYARNFSLDELTAIRSFVQTLAGAKFVQRGPALLADPDVAAWQRRLSEQGAMRLPEEAAKFRDEIQAIEKAPQGPSDKGSGKKDGDKSRGQ